jgi:hypothetical protein
LEKNLYSRPPSRVAGALLAEGYPQAIKLSLAKAFLTEPRVLKVLAKPGVSERVVAAIADHAKSSCQYHVRVALVRNAHTPAASVLAFLPQLILGDLKQISKLERLAPHLKKHTRERVVHRGNDRDAPARGRPVREIG